MADISARLSLPLLEAGQAQKEVTHNEALILLDAALCAVAETMGDDAPPADPDVGRCWIVGASPTGAWSGKAGALAVWSEGGWRFVPAREGLCVWVRAIGMWVRRDAGGWGDGTLSARGIRIGGQQVIGPRQPAISLPSGGAMVDTEARATLATVVSTLQSHGLIAS